jgi:hypothetical protein
LKKSRIATKVSVPFLRSTLVCSSKEKDENGLILIYPVLPSADPV